MHHVILERWSRRESWVHARDARVKIAALLVFLLMIATTSNGAWMAYAGYAAVALATVLAARLPLMSIVARASLVLPFTVVFALVSWLGGDTARAVSLVARSLLSATAVLLLVASTRLPDLLRGLEWLRVPHLLILIAQFLYRYLFVLSEQAQHMRLAAACRSGEGRRQRQRRRFEAAAGALAVLFARSYRRAEGVHQAMLARGFDGRFPALTQRAAGAADYLFLALAIVAAVSIRWAVGA